VYVQLRYLDHTLWTHIMDTIRKRGHYTSPEATPRGEKHWKAVLTPEMVLDIRRKSKAGATQMTLAAEFGISQQNVGKILNRKTWAHI
jgi:hypothetical protein